MGKQGTHAQNIFTLKGTLETIKMSMDNKIRSSNYVTLEACRKMAAIVAIL